MKRVRHRSGLDPMPSQKRCSQVEKWRYPTREVAIKAAARAWRVYEDTDIFPYFCQSEEHWHIGHKTKAPSK